MRSIALMAFLVLLATVAAIPITPSAAEYQRAAEEMRSEGMAEHDIAEQLSSTTTELEAQPQPFVSHITTRLHTLFHAPSEEEKRDASGDIAPGSLEAPQMLPRAAAPDSLADTISEMIKAVLGGDDVERRKFGYEGKELELRRPEGMRHWDF